MQISNKKKKQLKMYFTHESVSLYTFLFFLRGAQNVVWRLFINCFKRYLNSSNTFKIYITFLTTKSNLFVESDK
jgi:hypothetical protein